MDEIETAASPTLSEKGSTAMKQIVEAMDLVCSEYDVDIRNEVEEQEQGTGVDLV